MPVGGGGGTGAEPASEQVELQLGAPRGRVPSTVAVNAVWRLSAAQRRPSDAAAFLLSRAARAASTCRRLEHVRQRDVRACRFAQMASVSDGDARRHLVPDPPPPSIFPGTREQPRARAPRHMNCAWTSDGSASLLGRDAVTYSSAPSFSPRSSSRSASSTACELRVRDVTCRPELARCSLGPSPLARAGSPTSASTSIDSRRPGRQDGADFVRRSPRRESARGRAAIERPSIPCSAGARKAPRTVVAVASSLASGLRSRSSVHRVRLPSATGVRRRSREPPPGCRRHAAGENPAAA